MRIIKATFVFALLYACGGPKDKPAPTMHPEPVAAPAAKVSPEQQVVEDLAALQFDKLGNPVVRWDAIPKVEASKDNPHRLLVVLVEYDDVTFERYRGDKQQGTKLAAFYQERLFDESYSRKNTLSHYYATQSEGKYHVTGKVLPPVKLSKERASYGSAHRPAGGSWRNDTDPDGMVEEAVMLASKSNPDLPWADYDVWDPTDFDGDGNVNEPDGYVDHFVLVFAGGGQSSCQLLNKIGDVLTPNVGPEALSKLDKQQRECADRMWPHRDAMRRRESSGPKIAGTTHVRGGVPLSPSLWIYDYNMQSEYTESATFIHEFGHSIGLPDVYSRTSSNSTGGWEVMSSTADPSPQNLSAWSRMQLGWLKPSIVVPPESGGAPSSQWSLGLWSDSTSKASDAVMVILPPKKRTLELTTIPKAVENPVLGRSLEQLPKPDEQALYSGQGNEMNRTATLALDLSGARKASLSFSAWWEIEGGWDFAYVEASADGGASWQRLTPVNAKHMPAKHGHDGKNTKPGFTGLSGDFDGDGKNESISACDPKQEIKHGEDAAGEAKSPCLMPSWVWVSFDLGSYAGKKDVSFRIRYYTDAAAVMRGLLFNNVELEKDGAISKVELSAWTNKGFYPSTGRHELLVPHYYLFEYRDPYADSAYDSALADPTYSFYYDAKGKRMLAVASRPRPGVLAWYADGAFAWSENDPAINGPGKGYLLAVDGNPEEVALPGWTSWLQGSTTNHDTHYEVSGADAQAALKDAFIRTACFVRGTEYLPRGGLPTKNGKCPGRKKGAKPAVARLRIDGKTPMYSYQVINDYLPGERDGFEKVGELVDTKKTKAGQTYRLRDRSLRYLHTLDNPFSATPFERARVIYEVKGDKLVELEAVAAPANKGFYDNGTAQSATFNPKLPFSSVKLPGSSLRVSVEPPEGPVAAGTKAKVVLQWNTPPVPSND